jgi:hypothetical protein
MKRMLPPTFRRPSRTNRPARRQRPVVEALEDRLVLSGDLLVTTAGSYPQQFFKEFTPTGGLVRSLLVPPPPGSSGDTARDLVADTAGNVYVYNGTFNPALATYNPATNSWSQQTYKGWNTSNNMSYGGVGLFQNYVYASDMTIAGDPAGASDGIVRFNLSNGTATRFLQGTDFISLSVGLDGKLYGLVGGPVVFVIDPIGMNVLRTVNLPGSNDYRGVAANANGDIFTANWNNSVTHFSPTGTLLGSVTLTGPTNGSWFANPMDIAIAPDGNTVAVGTRSGHVVQMTPGLTNVTYFNTWTGSVQYPSYVTFAPWFYAPQQPAVSVNDITVTSATSGVTSGYFTVSLSAASNQPVTVNFTLNPGTAAPNVDYYPGGGTVTFYPGQTTQTVPVPVIGDPLYDVPETFTFNLANPSGATLGRAQGTCTIVSSLPQPTLTPYDTTLTNVPSGTTSASFLLRLSAGNSDPVTVGYATADGSATAGSDYQATRGTVTFAPGQTSQTVVVPVFGDPSYDANESFTLSLSNPTGATLTRPQATGTIFSSVPAPALSVADVSVTSPTSGTTPAVFNVTLSAPSGETTTVQYAAADGTAAAGSDYYAASGTLTFAPGQTSQTINVSVIGDPVYDPNETFTVNLSNPTNATLARAQATGTIVSGITPVYPGVSNVTVTNVPSGTTSANFNVTLSGPWPQTVTYYYTTANGSATAGSDYTATGGTVTFAPGQTSVPVSVPVLGDPLYDAPETFYLQLLGMTGAVVTQGTATILSSVPQPALAVGDVSVQDGTSGTTPAAFTVSLSAASNEPVTVSYATANGSADSSDYTPTSGTLTFAPGQTSQTVTVPVFGDPNPDANETFTLTLSGPSGATLARSQATATILAAVSVPSLGVADVTADNSFGLNGQDQATFTVSLTTAGTQPITVNYATADGTARAYYDYMPTSGTLTFAPGQTSQTVNVPLVFEGAYDPPETFTLNLSGANVANLVRAQATGTILSSLPVPSLTVNDVSVTAGTSGTTSATFTVSMVLGGNMDGVTVNYTTADGTATAGSDYTATSGTLSFAATQTSLTVTVPVLGDPNADPNETFTLNLTNPVGATLTRAQGTATIVSSAPLPSLSVNDVSVANEAGGMWALFTVNLSPAAATPVTTYFTTAPGTATAPDEYTTVWGTLTFQPGDTSQSVIIPVAGDPLYDAPETFTFNLSNASGAAIARAQATATIQSAVAAPSVRAQGVTVDAGSAGTTAPFTVTLSAPSDETTTIDYATSDATALAGTDYQAARGTLTFAPGQTSLTIPIPVFGQPNTGAQKTLTLTLSNPSNATLWFANATDTIIDAPPQVSVSDSSATVTESDTGPAKAVFYAVLSNPVNQTVTVNYATADGTATAGSDYQATSGTLTFAPGQTTLAVPVTIVRDPLVESAEQYTLNLSNPSGATLGNATGVGGILSGEHAPVVNAGPDQTVNEGATLAFDASGSSDADQDPLTFSWDFGDGGTASGATPTHVYADNGTYTVTVSVSDGANVTIGTLTVTVLNVPPTAAVSGPADAVPGEDRTFTLSASDPSPVDQAAGFTYTVSWGDGTTQTVQGPGAGVAADHVYAAAGSYTVSVTATDKDNGTGPAATQGVTVVPAELQGGDLYVGGTPGADTITVQPADANGTVDVVVNGQDQGMFVPTGQVVVYGQAGDDVIQVVPLSSGGGTVTLNLPVVLFGSDGNDVLDARGAGGPAVLVGGAGDDTLYGGGGRNLLIGGTGANVLVGGGDDDLLIAGSTLFDANLAALVALRNEWARTDADYQTRVGHLNGSLGGGLNGVYLLNGQSVTAAGAVNTLTGAAGQDWFFAVTGGSNPDLITDLEAGEIVTSL